MRNSPTLNNYIDQVRFRTESAERSLGGDLKALHSSQAAEGNLKSGATIIRTLRKFEENFDNLTDAILVYLGKAIERTKLDRAELLSATASLLHQSLLSFKAITNREKLLRLVDGGRIDAVIEESFARANQGLNLKLQEFGFGLHDAVPQAHIAKETMNSREFRERVLIALYRKAMRDGVDETYDPQIVAEAAGLKWKPGQLGMVVASLEASGLLESSQLLGGDADGGLEVTLSQLGLEEAEELIEQNVEYEEDDDETYGVAQQVPASNRYVTLLDNQREEVSEGLIELKDAVRGANEIDDEYRQTTLSEIAVFEATIAAPRVAQDLIDRFVSSVLKRMTMGFAQAAFAVVAERLIRLLLPYL